MSTLSSQATELFRNLKPEKQERIFQAAVEEFASKGYRNASMNALVKAAGISKGILFQYFRTKRDLFDNIVEVATGRTKAYLKIVRDESADVPFFKRLEKLIRAGFDFIDQHPLLARIYFHLLQSGEAPSGPKRISRLRKEGEEFLAELIRASLKRGELREGLDVDRVAFLMNALLETLLRAYYTEFLATGLGLYRGDPSGLDLWVKTTLDLFRNGLEAK